MDQYTELVQTIQLLMTQFRASNSQTYRNHIIRDMVDINDQLNQIYKVDAFNGHLEYFKNEWEKGL